MSAICRATARDVGHGHGHNEMEKPKRRVVSMFYTFEVKEALAMEKPRTRSITEVGGHVPYG